MEKVRLIRIIFNYIWKVNFTVVAELFSTIIALLEIGTCSAGKIYSKPFFSTFTFFLPKVSGKSKFETFVLKLDCAKDLQKSSVKALLSFG